MLYFHYLATHCLSTSEQTKKIVLKMRVLYQPILLINVVWVRVLPHDADTFHFTFNSSPPRAAYMCQWLGSALVQKMACRLLNQCWVIINRTLRNKLRNFSKKSNFFVQENAFENFVCEMTAILSKGRWVKNICTNMHTYDTHTSPSSSLSSPSSSVQ